MESLQQDHVESIWPQSEPSSLTVKPEIWRLRAILLEITNSSGANNRSICH